jgi:hypothetical protein
MIITVQVSIMPGGPSTIRNTAKVSTKDDSYLPNNVASDVVQLQRPELAPAASPAGLVVSVIALIGVAAWSLRRRPRSAP